MRNSLAGSEKAFPVAGILCGCYIFKYAQIGHERHNYADLSVVATSKDASLTTHKSLRFPPDFKGAIRAVCDPSR